MRIVDGFSGSTVVSRELASLAYDIHSNDMENYAYLMARCFMEKPSQQDQEEIAFYISSMNKLAENGPYTRGIISKLYAPDNTFDIKGSYFFSSFIFRRKQLIFFEILLF